MFLLSTWVLALDVFVLCLFLTIIKWKRFLVTTLFGYQHPYPPGPPSRSWIWGNYADLSAGNQVNVYAEWFKQYGDVVHFRTFNEHFILVSSREAATEIFEKRSNNYSSRTFPKMAELMGWHFLTGFKPYGERWRAERRLLQQHFKPEAIPRYFEIMEQKINVMLRQLLTDPDRFRDHIRNLSGAIIMSTVYDYELSPHGDAYVKIAEESLERLGEATFAGAMLVNSLPFLRHLPGWLPGCGFHRYAQNTKVMTDQMLNDPLTLVEKRMASGIAHPCIAAELLVNPVSPIQYIDIKNVCGTSYAAGADTTVSATSTFFYAMANHYDVQLKAQAEIDDLIGRDRLPCLEDRAALPYAEALYREILRWQPVVPLSIFHASRDDDIYKGYYIPKGATVIPNIRAMSRDSTRYVDPESFNPSRFIKDNGTLNDDDVNYTFGFGRRICPGRHFASATLWLSIVRVLYLFDIRRKKDVFGNEIPVNSGYTPSLVTHPLPFECSITPRSHSAHMMLFEAITEKFSDFKM
ncbi:cytochrome P450 [Crepidotus variabilis]|uniref:Cytochrome P450 n=1 Tax=Crepidotus variabilis TaxID=179855 RepID=A0A9P6EQR3_9AGAR|nr:cytochrome P450 [Crepidotus variabilis]